MADPQLRPAESTILAGALVVAAVLVSFGALHHGFFTKKLLPVRRPLVFEWLDRELAKSFVEDSDAGR